MTANTIINKRPMTARAKKQICSIKLSHIEKRIEYYYKTEGFLYNFKKKESKEDNKRLHKQQKYSESEEKQVYIYKVAKLAPSSQVASKRGLDYL